MWIATLSLWGTFTSYSFPVLIGVPEDMTVMEAQRLAAVMRPTSAGAITEHHDRRHIRGVNSRCARFRDDTAFAGIGRTDKKGNH